MRPMVEGRTLRVEREKHRAVRNLYEPGGARLRRALMSVLWRSGLDGVSPHHSWSQCAVAKPWRLSMYCAVVGQPSWLPVLRACLTAENLSGGDAARTGRRDACPTLSGSRSMAPIHVRILEVFPLQELPTWPRTSVRALSNQSAAANNFSLLTLASFSLWIKSKERSLCCGITSSSSSCSNKGSSKPTAPARARTR